MGGKRPPPGGRPPASENCAGTIIGGKSPAIEGGGGGSPEAMSSRGVLGGPGIRPGWLTGRCGELPSTTPFERRCGGSC